MSLTQGHAYTHNGRKVIALETGEHVPVRMVLPDDPSGVGPRYHVYAWEVLPRPMVYFKGAIPK